MRLLIGAVIVASTVLTVALATAAEHNPVRTHPAAAHAGVQLIVKLRAAAGAAAAGSRASAQQVAPAQERLASIAARNGINLRSTRAITEKLLVMRLDANGAESLAETLAKLRADSEVEYAEPDQRRYVHGVTPPNDPLYPNQWYLQNAANTPAATDFITAWAVSIGSPSIVIADLDTGVLYGHPDLKAVAAGGRLLPGYCFISDSFVNNGGTCLGGTISNAEASDPGDWITSSDVSGSPNGECKGAQVEPSSWHGTRTAGILGALTNNSTGVAATTWQGQILPVRVLGKCGGSDSDIIMGMLWAAGITVTDAPTNPTPAKVINMSLGGSGSCPQSYKDAISQITALGVLVVVSAGNENGPVDTPANCAGVAGIAGLRHVGTKVGYSSFGAEVAVSAPAGNCVNTGGTQPCLYPISTTTNLSTTTPDANAEDYTGEFACGGTASSPTSYPGCTIGTNQYRTPNLGTSFSAPIVSGIAALMAATNSHLNACQLISRLKEGAAPFPQTSAGDTTQPPVCPQFDPTSQECICPQNGSQCGAGIANAPGALTAASRPVAVVALPASVAAGQSVALNASGSVAANSRTLSSFQWSSPTLPLQGASTPTVTVNAPSCGFGTVHLVVTDNAGQSDAADVVLSTTDATSTAPATPATTSCSGALSPKLAVCPSSASVQTGGNQFFTASFANMSNEQVTWEVNGVAGGNGTVGTVTSSGVYTAPANVPMPATVKVEAVSVADNTVQSSTSVTITAPPSSHGGGSLDLFTLLVESLALGGGLIARFYARRWAASSQVFCARR